MQLQHMDDMDIESKEFLSFPFRSAVLKAMHSTLSFPMLKSHSTVVMLVDTIDVQR